MTHLLRTLFVVMVVLGRMPLAAAALPTGVSVPQIKPASTSQSSKKDFKRSLSGLYAIETWNGNQVRQRHSEFDALYANAQRAQAELGTLVNEIGMLSQATPIIPPVKSTERAQAKIAQELNGEAAKITDLARATLVAKDINGIVTAFEILGKDAEILQVKNRFKSPAPSGYRDLKVLVRLPKSQHIAEVQIHLNAIAEIKSGEEHEVYQQVQHIERIAASESRGLNDLEQAKIARLRQYSQTLYQFAWQQYLQPSTMAS
ncbi:RelA/SpoT domain-containing protein [Thaumasiovibrio sp. DFM-14]|uniref:RelA/SpoT domain-containing protein n=1 Tax=Thaumasiovibrio sp. DFM-14 TaxID=3384792 RepID=UPI0039A363EC